MRNVKTIEADISKLQAELADVKDHESMRDSAVHILKNLGWTRRYGKWMQPVNRPDLKVFDKDTMTHIKEGDFVTMKVGLGDIWYVRTMKGTTCMLSRVTRITPYGTSAGMLTYPTSAHKLRVIDAKAHMGYVRNA